MSDMEFYVSPHVQGILHYIKDHNVPYEITYNQEEDVHVLEASFSSDEISLTGLKPDAEPGRFIFSIRLHSSHGKSMLDYSPCHLTFLEEKEPEYQSIPDAFLSNLYTE